MRAEVAVARGDAECASDGRDDAAAGEEVAEGSAVVASETVPGVADGIVRATLGVEVALEDRPS
jgi:hypothetical protein